jgi:hypothetical protein
MKDETPHPGAAAASAQPRRRTADAATGADDHDEPLAPGPLARLRQDWRINGRCYQERVDPESFFPRGRPRNASVDFCDGCSVRQECVDAALESPWRPHGIWGGLTEKELYPLWRALRSTQTKSEIVRAIRLKEGA